MKSVLSALAAICAAGAPAAAQQPLPLKAGKAWKHKHSGIAVPAMLGDAARAQGMAYAPDDLDVGLSYTVGDAVESLTFYVFRNTNGAVPVWFAQAQWGIENRDTFGHPTIVVAPQAFVPPGQASASGLKAIYEPKGGGYRSTGVMLMPVGQWYVKLRASSQTRSPAELAIWMDAALAQITWPKQIAVSPEAVPVTDCPAPLTFAVEAKDAPKDGGSDMMSGLLGMMVANGKAKPTPESAGAIANARWCRDAALSGKATAYRRDADADRYLLAVGDNGNGVWVGPDAGAALNAQIDAAKSVDPRYSITLMTAAKNVDFVAQDRLPSPQRVMDIINANRSVTTVPTWGKDRTISVNSNSF